MKYYTYILILFFISCKYVPNAYKFSNFNETPQESIAKAIKQNDIQNINEEIKNKKIDVNYKEKKYGTSLLSLAIVNERKKSFEALLKLGCDVNIEGPKCMTPLKQAVKYSEDLFYISKLIEYGANVNIDFLNKCNYSYNTIFDTILYYNDNINQEFCKNALELLTNKLSKSNLLTKNNESHSFKKNFLYYCLKVKNMGALRFFVINKKCFVPPKVYINEVVLTDFKGYKSLEEILEHEEFNFTNSKKKNKARKDVLKYLKNNKVSE